jgi:hypothetical protein
MAPKPCLLCNDADSRLATGRGAYVTMDTYGIYAPASSGIDSCIAHPDHSLRYAPQSFVFAG